MQKTFYNQKKFLYSFLFNEVNFLLGRIKDYKSIQQINYFLKNISHLVR